MGAAEDTYPCLHEEDTYPCLHAADVLCPGSVRAATLSCSGFRTQSRPWRVCWFGLSWAVIYSLGVREYRLHVPRTP